MKEIKQLTKPEYSRSEQQAFEAFKNTLFTDDKSSLGQLCITLSYLKNHDFNLAQIEGLSLIRYSKPELLFSALLPLQTLCFQYGQANEADQRDIKARFNDKTFRACSEGAVENLMQLMGEIQSKNSLKSLLFTAKTHVIEQLAIQFLKENDISRGDGFHSHDVASLRWAINHEFKLGMTANYVNQYIIEHSRATTQNWLEYLENYLFADTLIDHVVQNIDWQTHQPVDQHPTICVMDQQDSTHELNKENTLYVIGGLRDIQLWFVGQPETRVGYDDLGFSKPVALDLSMLKSYFFLERLLSCCAVNGLPLKVDRTATQANYQSLLGMDEKTFQTLEPFLFHGGYAARTNDDQLTQKLIVQAAASSQNLLHPSFIDQLKIKSLPMKFEDRQGIRLMVEQYQLFSWYIMKLIDQDLLKDEIDGINQGPVNVMHKSFLRENLAYAYWQGAFNELGSSIKQEVEDAIKGADAISHMYNNGFSSAFNMAAKQNNMGIIQHFLECGSPKNQILLSVIYNEGYTLAKQLIESGADINEKEVSSDMHIIAFALASNNTNMVRFIVEQPSFSLENIRLTEQQDI